MRNDVMLYLEGYHRLYATMEGELTGQLERAAIFELPGDHKVLNEFVKYLTNNYGPDRVGMEVV